MNRQLFRSHPFLQLTFLFIVTFTFNACMALDGIFPKFKPNSEPTEEVTLLPEPTEQEAEKEVPAQKDTSQLENKIVELEKQLSQLRQDMQLQRQEFGLLQEQWETNFVLLERSVTDSLKTLRSNSGSGSSTSGVSQKQQPEISSSSQTVASNNNRKQQNTTKVQSTSKSSPPKLETYSLFKNKKPEETPVEQNDLSAINDLEIIQDPVLAEEEPGFPGSGVLNPEDLEDPVDMPDPATRAIEVAASVKKKNKKKAPATIKKKGYQDPDLNAPSQPRLLIRHAGVKKIYNQGMTAIIQENYEQAIRIFQNFTQRFPDDLDSDNAYYWIGHSQFELGKMKKAETAFRQVLKLYEHRPTSQGYKTPDAIYMLGKLHKKRNDLEKSKYYFNEAIKRFPGSAAARNAKRDLQN